MDHVMKKNYKYLWRCQTLASTWVHLAGAASDGVGDYTSLGDITQGQAKLSNIFGYI